MTPDDPSTGPTRRQLLAGSGALALTGGLAGCVEALPPLGRRVAIGNVDVPAAGPPEYRSWVPSPAAVPELSFPPHDVLLAKPSSIQHTESDGLSAFPRAVIESSVDWFGSGYDAYERVIKMGNVYAMFGDIEPSTVETALEPTSYEKTGSDAGYALYSRSDVPRTVAVEPGVLLYAVDPLSERQDDDTEGLVKAVADAGTGRIERRHESDTDFARLTEAVGERPVAWVGPAALDPTGEAVAGAISEVVDGAEAYQLLYMLYPAGVEPPVRAIEREIEANARSVVSDRSEVSSDGRVAVVEGVRDVTPVGEYEGLSWPQVTWGVDQDGNTVTVSHETGERADAAKLALSSLGEDGSQDPTDTQFADRFDSVGPGDALSVTIDDSTVQVVLEYRQTEHRKGRLLAYRVP